MGFAGYTSYGKNAGLPCKDSILILLEKLVVFQATVSDDKYCMVEYRPHKIITDLLKHNPLTLDNDGRITVPTGAGLGVELNDEFRN